MAQKHNYTIYTANLGDYDPPRTDILCFNESYNRFVDPRLNAKIYKVLYYQFVDTEWSIWIDCNRFLKIDPIELIDMCNGYDMGILEHPYRNCIYEEAEICKKLKLDRSQIIDEQISRYKLLHYPQNNGLYACNLIIRKNTKEIRQLCQEWWAEITSGSWRDQISFPFVFRQKTNIKYISKTLADSIYYRPYDHKKRKTYT
jgi:hypothetical protein